MSVSAAVAAMPLDTEAGRRRWGYVVWGLTGLAIAVPEIWAAKWPDNAKFPTISGTVGYIEYWHDWVALLVLAVLVWAGFHAVEFRHPQAYVDSPNHTDGGYTLVHPKEPFTGAAAVAYYVVAVVCTVVGPLLVDQWRPDDEYLLGEVMYGSIALFAFVLPRAAALFWGKDVPFTTLFGTIRNIERRFGQSRSCLRSA